MRQPEKPTLAWAVVASRYGGRPAVREIIGRSDKGVRLRSTDWGSKFGDFCKFAEIAEFPSQSKAEAAVERYDFVFGALDANVKALRQASTAAQLAYQQAKNDQRAAALAAIKGDQG